MDRRRWSEPVDERIVAEGMQLGRREMLRIERGAQLLLAAQTGALWITEEGKPEDILVTPGRWYRIEADAPAIAMALEPAQVTISAPLAAPRRWHVERIAAHGRRAILSARSRGNPLVRSLTAALLLLYRAGAAAARRVARSARRAQAAEDIARLAAQLDARTRRDIGLEGHVASFVEGAERFRWMHDLHGPSRQSTFL